MDLTNKEAMAVAHLALGGKITTDDKGKPQLYTKDGHRVKKVKTETIESLERMGLIGPAVGDGFTSWFLLESVITKRYIPTMPAVPVAADYGTCNHHIHAVGVGSRRCYREAGHEGDHAY